MSFARALASRPWLTGLVMLIALHDVVHADTYPRQPGVDAIHYIFRLSFNDANDEIAGESTVTLKLAAGVSEVFLDLPS